MLRNIVRGGRPGRQHADLNERTPLLFPELPTRGESKRKLTRLVQPIWTEHKARFIERYVYFFVQVTKHGTYIDGFAGPQRIENPEAWAAKLVLSTEPPWMRHFYLCEKNARKAWMLRSLARSVPNQDKRGRKLNRSVDVYEGDFNEKVDEILDGKKISQNEATFCLLDQRTFECDWATVEKIARYKSEGHKKIELFYFLGVGWLHRALSAVQCDRAERWWGRADWQRLKSLTSDGIRDEFVNRFATDLGYKWVMPYPIFERKQSNHIMYYMIHASDHDEAPLLMVRAYNRAVRTLSRATQREFWE